MTQVITKTYSIKNNSEIHYWHWHCGNSHLNLTLTEDSPIRCCCKTCDSHEFEPFTASKDE